MTQQDRAHTPSRNGTRRLAPAALAAYLVIALFLSLILVSAVTHGIPGALFMAGIATTLVGAATLIKARRTHTVLRKSIPIIAVGLAATVAGALLIPSSPEPATSTDQSPPGTSSSTEPSPALTAALNLQLKGRAPRTGYDRDIFGQAWLDVDRNGCDTRNDILGRDLTNIEFKPGTNDCKVLAGTLLDPYTATTITFVNGATTSDDIQIDHVVALSDAWQKGAQGWDTSKREHFANDPLNLLAVDGPTNQQKGDGDAATWLPPKNRCNYVARQTAVKAKYELWVTTAERDAIVDILEDCPAQQLPPDTSLPTAAATTSTPTQAPQQTQPTPADTCPIKGNINSQGDHIYHVPGSNSYEQTQIDESKGERWFCSPEEAEAAGWRAPRG